MEAPVNFSRWLAAPPEVIEPEFNNFGWCSIEIAIADPRRPRPYVDQARPALPLTAVRELDKVELLEAFQLRAHGFIRDASDCNVRSSP